MVDCLADCFRFLFHCTTGEVHLDDVVQGELYVMKNPRHGNPENADLDIVFFHGLQICRYENAYKSTWTTRPGKLESPILWPKDWLGEDFPEARILTVSYNSQCMGDGVQSIRAIANTVLKNLVELAKVGNSRPVILVGHSLGGLIIKALCLEATEECIRQCNPEDLNRYKEFKRNIVGVYFYATPHGGAPLAKWASLLFGWLLPLSPALRYLAQGNYDLIDLTTDFEARCTKYKWRTEALAETLPTTIVSST